MFTSERVFESLNKATLQVAVSAFHRGDRELGGRARPRAGAPRVGRAARGAPAPLPAAPAGALDSLLSCTCP